MEATNKTKPQSSPKRMGHGPMGSMHGGEKAKNFKKSSKNLLIELKSVKWQLSMATILAVVSAVVTAFLPKILQKVFSKFSAFFYPNAVINAVFNDILNLLIFLLCLYFGVLIVRAISEVILTRAGQKICFNLREKMRKKLSSVKLKFYDNSSSGDLISRVITDADTISSNLQTLLSQTIVSIFTVVTILIFMFTMSWQLSLISLAILPISLGAGLGVMLAGKKYFTAQARGLGEVTAICEENYSALRTVQAYGMENEVSLDFDKHNKDLVKNTRKGVVFAGLMGPIINFINNFSYVFLATVGCIFALDNIITVAALLIFLQYSTNFNQQILQITQVTEQLQTTAAAFERISEVLNTENDTQTLEPIDNHEIVGKIEFKEVQFGYNENKLLMKNVNFVVNPGETVAVVGKTGAGKTTLVNLLMRFYDINGGKILLDDIDIKDFSKSFVRKNIGMVLQDVWLFNGTIAENIAFGHPDATMEEIIEASKKAECHHFISTLPEGYNTIIGEDGGNMSVGQKQLLTIARALLTNPKIIILDEATSSVDTKTEAKIQSAMNTALNGRTSFVIAHRLSTIVNADKILVMENGDIIESGTHFELLKQNGAYAKLYNSQL